MQNTPPKVHTWVRVYRNLSQHCFSVQTKTPQGWRVTHHAKQLVLHKCKFEVSEAGRQRAIRQGHRNVHAYIYGEWVNSKPEYHADVSHFVYTRYRHDINTTFIAADTKEPITRARMVVGSIFTNSLGKPSCFLGALPLTSRLPSWFKTNSKNSPGAKCSRRSIA